MVEFLEDIPNLTIKNPAKLVYLTHTTLSQNDAVIIIRALKGAFPLLKERPSSDIY